MPGGTGFAPGEKGFDMDHVVMAAMAWPLLHHGEKARFQTRRRQAMAERA
jgi:hypothetical protein